MTLAALALAAAGGCADEAPDAAWCRGDLGSERVVVNQGEGRWDAAGLRAGLEELWRVGGLREGQALSFPADLAASRSGRLAVADFRLGDVVVIDRDGGWLGSWTRRGEGPGEVSRPVAVSWTGDGRLAVFDIEGSRVIWLAGPSEATREVPIDPAFTAPVVASGSLVRSAVAPDGTVYLQPSRSSVPGEARALDLLTRFRPTAGVTDTVRVDTVPTLEASGRFASVVAPDGARLTFALGPDGGLRLSDPRGRYRLLEVGRGPGADRAVCRASAPPPLAGGTLGEGDSAERSRALAEALAGAEPPERAASFGRFFVGARGRTWVQRDVPVDPSGPDAFFGAPGAEHDVFAADGRYLGSVTPPDDARLQAARGDTVWAYEFGELDEAWVVAYRLVLRGGGNGS